MIRENIGLAAIEPRLQPQEEEAVYDFSSCQRMKKLTTHDIYRFVHNTDAMIVKLFAPNAVNNYQTELACLLRTHHPSILKVLYHRPSINATSTEPLLRSHLIVMREATRGDLNDYLPRYGKMNEKMARTYFKDLVESLHSLAELKPALIHPNLLASNLLLTEQGQLRICGWSEVSPKGEVERLKESVFSCGEILICLLTSFMPFYKKNSPTDAYFKFLSQDHIHKFWQELQKKMTKVDKKFAFSSEVKDLLQAIFLKKYTKFEQILSHQWTKGEVYTPAECLKELTENERTKNEKMQAKKQLQAINEQQKRKALHQYHISFGLQRSANTQNQQFIKDCQQNIIRQQEIPTSEPLSCLKISATPNFVIASLKDFLRNQNGKCSVLLCQQFILSNHKVVKSQNYVIIDLDFSISELQEQQDDLIQPESCQTVSLRLKVCFLRQDKEIFADVTVLQSNFNTYYTNLALHFIEERITRRKESQQ